MVTEKAEPMQHCGQTEPFPELKIKRSKSGLNEASNQAACVFNRGLDSKDAGDLEAAVTDFEESVKWYTNWIWVEGMVKIPGVPVEERAKNHSYRALALTHLLRWEEAEADYSEAIALTDYGKDNDALVTMYLPEFWTDGQRLLEAQENGTVKVISEKGVRFRLSRCMGDRDPLGRKVGGGWTLDSRDGIGKLSEGWLEVKVKKLNRDFKEQCQYSRAQARYELGMVKGAEKDIDEALAVLENAPAKKKQAEKLKEQINALRDKQIEERRAAGEPFPEIEVERSLKGIEEVKCNGIGSLSRARSVAWNVGGHWQAAAASERAVKDFAKAIWVVGTGEVSGVSDELRSELHHWRAVALARVGRWEEAEADCSEAIAFSGNNLKALYIRAEARYNRARAAKDGGYSGQKKDGGAQQAKLALQDIEQVLKDATSLQGIEEREGDAKKIKENIEALLALPQKRIAACEQPAWR